MSPNLALNSLIVKAKRGHDDHFAHLTTKYSRRVGRTVTGRQARSPQACACTSCVPDSMDATAAMMKDTMTPGPAISLATRPDTTYIPVPTQLPTPSEMRSTVVSTWASLVPCAVVAPVPSSMDSTGLVRRILECMAYQAAPHCTRRGSREARKPLILSEMGCGEGQLIAEGCRSLSGCFWNSSSDQGSPF